MSIDIEPPFTSRRARIGHAGRKAEKKAGARMGGRQVPASGAMQGAKGDLRMQAPVLVEVKSTQKDSFSLKYDVLKKIAIEAQEVQREPSLLIEFTDGDGNVRPRGSWVCLPALVFQEMMERMK